MNISVTQPAGVKMVGQPILRREDARMLTGRGSFTDDIRLKDFELRRRAAVVLRPCPNPFDRRVARSRDARRHRRAYPAGSGRQSGRYPAELGRRQFDRPAAPAACLRRVRFVEGHVGQIGAEIGERAQFDTENRAVVLNCSFDISDVRAVMAPLHPTALRVR